MSYEKCIDRIAAWLEKQDIPVDEEHRDILKKIWKKWAESHPFTLTANPENGQPELHMISEVYTGHSSRTDSKEVSEPCTIFNAHRFSSTPEGKFYYLHGRIAPKDAGKPLDSLRWPEPEPGQRLDYSRLLTPHNSQQDVQSLVHGLSAYIVTFAGFYPADRITNLVTEWELERRRSVLGGYIHAQLTPEMSAILDNTRTYISETMEWLLAGHNETLQAYRTQAASAFPLLLPLFDGRFSYRDRDYYIAPRQKLNFTDAFGYDGESYQELNERLNEIRAGIDRGEPLLPLLQEKAFPFAVPGALIRNLGKIKSQPENMDMGTLIHSLSLLKDMPPDFHPKTDEDFNACVKCIYRASLFQNMLDLSMEDILSEIKGDWKGWEEKTESVRAIEDVWDWISEVNDVLIWPSFWQKILKKEDSSLAVTFAEASAETDRPLGEMKKEMTELVDALAKDLLKKRSLAELVACSQQWHKDMREYNTQLSAISAATANDLCSWEPISKTVRAPNGIWLRPLVSKKELQKEGDAQAHCVGTSSVYYTQCLAGHDHIISLTDDREGQERLTTVQLREKRNYNRDITDLEVLQHQGFKRRPPDEREKEAIRWYCDTILNNPDYRPDWEKIDKAREQARQQCDGRAITQELGFDPLDTDSCALAYELIRPYLPKKLAKQNFEAITKKIGKMMVSQTDHENRPAESSRPSCN